MKKWWAACLLAIGLLCVATSAMAAHIRLNGDYCEGNSFQIRESKTTEEYHTLYCFHCQEEFTENHWSTDTPPVQSHVHKTGAMYLLSYDLR